MKGAAKQDTPRVCARNGCDQEPPTRRHRYCTPACRARAKTDRRLARARAATAEQLAATKARVIEQVKALYYLTAAAQSAGVSRSTAYRWLDTDPDFAAEVDIARRIAADTREVDVLVAAQPKTVGVDADGHPVQAVDFDALKAAVTVARRIDANELRRVRAGDRSNRQDRHERRTTPAAEIPAPDCDAALEWARRPLLEAV